MIPDLSKDAPMDVNENGGKQSKLDVSLVRLPPNAIFAVGRVLATGAKKYPDDQDGTPNWHRIDVRDHLNHMLTHAMAYLAGDTQDDHLEHMACRALMALERKYLDDQKKKLDDFWEGESKRFAAGLKEDEPFDFGMQKLCENINNLDDESDYCPVLSDAKLDAIRIRFDAEGWDDATDASATAAGFKVSSRPVSKERRELLEGDDITTSGGCRTVHGPITSPGQAIYGFQITPEDASLIQQMNDPNLDVGKPTLKCGEASPYRDWESAYQSWKEKVDVLGISPPCTKDYFYTGAFSESEDWQWELTGLNRSAFVAGRQYRTKVGNQSK